MNVYNLFLDEILNLSQPSVSTYSQQENVETIPGTILVSASLQSHLAIGVICHINIHGLTFEIK